MAGSKHTIEIIEQDLLEDEQVNLLEKGWIIQKVGWALIIATMIAGALGLFGEGIVSEKKITSGATTIEFERFFRHEAEMKVVIESKDHIASIALPQEYLKNFRIVRFVPESDNNVTLNGNVQFNFLPGDNHTVTFYLIPKEFGSIGGTMKVNGNNFSLNHYIYP